PNDAATRRVATHVSGGEVSRMSHTACGATAPKNTATATHGAAERKYARRLGCVNAASASAASRNADQYFDSIAAAAARPASAAQLACRVSSARSIAHIASAQSGINTEFWSNLSPRKL